VVWDPHTDVRNAAAATFAVAHPELVGKRTALFVWSDSVSPGALVGTKDPLFGGTMPPTLPLLSN